MKQGHIDKLKLNNQVTASSETFTSPTIYYIKLSDAQYGLDGAIVKFQVKPGTLDQLKGMALKNDSHQLMSDLFNGTLPPDVFSGWPGKNKALFKTESYRIGSGPNDKIFQVNIGLGKPKPFPEDPKSALDVFNENIISFEIIPY